MGIDIAAERRRKNLAIQRQEKKEKRARMIKIAARSMASGFADPTHVCTQCGIQGRPKLITKGSLLIEIFLWICFLLPGLCYSIWRHASRFYGCPDCRTQTMIKIDSPMGKKMTQQ